MPKRSGCTTKIVAALVIGLLVGSLFLILLQNKFFRQPKPDDDKAVAKQKNICTYTCQVSASQNAKGPCPAAQQLLEKGRTIKPEPELGQTTDLLLVRRMNDLGWRLAGGDSKNGWNSALSFINQNLQYECAGKGVSTQTTNVVLEVVGACPPKEQVCPNGILEQLPAGAKTDQNYATAFAEANANAQAQMQDCQKFMNKRCEKLSDGASERYWKTYDDNKIVTEALAHKQHFCDRREVIPLKEYASDEQYDSIDAAKDQYAKDRIATVKAYLEALTNPLEINNIKGFIEADLAEKNSEVGGGLVKGQSPNFEAVPPVVKVDNRAYFPSSELLKRLAKDVYSIWHIHAIAENGNPSEEGPSGDPTNSDTQGKDFKNVHSYTNGEVVITYMGKDSAGKICFNVKFYTKEGTVVDLGDYDP